MNRRLFTITFALRHTRDTCTDNPRHVPTAAVITDNDFNKVSGVTTTLKALITHAPADWRVRVYTAADVEVDAPHYLAMASWGVGLPRYPDMRIYWPHVQRLRRLLRDDGADVVHITTPGPVGLAARWLHRREPRPLVGSYHTHLGDYVSTYSGLPSLGRAFEAYMRWLYAPCHSLLVPSEATRAMLATRGYRASGLHLWSRGVDLARFTPDAASPDLRRLWSADDGRMVLVYVGRLAAEKGLDMLPALQRTLIARHVPHRLIVVGDGPMRALLQQQCPEAVFTGTVGQEEVARIVASADAFVFPSATDSLGNVVVEAQACGCPVLVTNMGGPCEQMRHGETGWVCNAGDVDAFAARVAEWYAHPALRRRMGETATIYAATRSWPASLRPLFQAWDAAIAQDRPRAQAI